MHTTKQEHLSDDVGVAALPKPKKAFILLIPHCLDSALRSMEADVNCNQWHDRIIHQLSNQILTLCIYFTEGEHVYNNRLVLFHLQ